jgi:uncharacterized membrane protein
MSANQTDVVGEYLREVELRLSGLPLLQRRELLADLETHIATARAERGAPSEGELIEILERLGSPEVVAAAAYEEAGPPRAPAVAPGPAPVAGGGRPVWLIGLVIAAAVLFLLGCVGLLTFARSDSGGEPSVPMPAPASPR